MLLPIIETFHTLQGEGAWTGTAAWFVRLGGCDVGCSWCDAKETWNPRVHPPVSVDDVVAGIIEGGSSRTPSKDNPVSSASSEAVGSPRGGSGEPSSASRSSLSTFNFRRAERQPSLLGLSEARMKVCGANFQLSTPPVVVVTGGEPLMWDLGELCSLLREKGFKTHLETSGSHPFSGTWDWVCLSPKRRQPPLDEAWGRAHELKVIVESAEDLEWAEECAARVEAAFSRQRGPDAALIDTGRENEEAFLTSEGSRSAPPRGGWGAENGKAEADAGVAAAELLGPYEGCVAQDERIQSELSGSGVLANFPFSISHFPLFLQPEWSRREEVMPLIVEYIKAHPWWRASLQTHKYMHIP